MSANIDTSAAFEALKGLVSMANTNTTNLQGQILLATSVNMTPADKELLLQEIRTAIELYAFLSTYIKLVDDLIIIDEPINVTMSDFGNLARVQHMLTTQFDNQSRSKIMDVVCQNGVQVKQLNKILLSNSFN
jgi:hypothetical protein